MDFFEWTLNHIKYNTLNRVIDKPEINVGRSKGFDIPSKNINVSRRHATFTVTEDRKLYVKDHNTLNGTFVNKKKIESNVLVELHDNDEIGLGVQHEDVNENKNDSSSADLIFIVKQNPVRVKLENVSVDNFLDETNKVNVEVPEIKKESNVPNESNDCIVVSDDEESSSLLNHKESSVLSVANDVSNFLKPSSFSNASVGFSASDKLDDDNTVISNEDLLRILAASQFQEENKEKRKDGADFADVGIKNEIICNYTVDDDFIVVSDDDENVHYSQLLDDCGTGARNDTDRGLNDTLFDAIKKEVEELDKVPAGTVFSRFCVDEDGNSWISDICEERGDSNEATSSPNRNAEDVKIRDPVVLLKPMNIENDRENNAMEVDNDELLYTNVYETEQQGNKRKQTEKQNGQTKKLRASKFYGKTPVTKSFLPQSNQDIKNIRKQKLKEIAKKSSLEHDSKKTENHKLPLAAKYVKVSDSRGKFLIENEPVPSTSKEPLARASKTDANIKLGKLEPKKLIPIIPPHVISKKRRGKKEETSVQPNTINKTNPKNTPLKAYQELEDVILKIIHWNPIWFNEYLKNPEWGLPKAIKELRVMAKSFSSYSDYYEVVIPQMLMELWHFFYKEVFTFSDPRKKKFFAVLQEERYIPQKKYTQLSYTTFINKKENDDHLHVKEDDVVIIEHRRQEEDVIKGKFGLGYVIKVTKKILQERDHIDQDFVKFIEIEPHAVVNFQILVKSSPGKAIVGKYSKIRIITSVVSSMRIFKSVYRLKDSLLQEHILKPTKTLYKFPSIRKQTVYSQEILNDAQRKAVLEASTVCLRDLPGIYLIQGPPGTGKTTVILNIIQQILFHPNNSSHKCILVVAPSNGAVDELAIRIMALKPKFADAKKKLKLVRIGPKHMVHPKVQDYLLYEIAKRNLTTELMNTESKSNRELLQLKYKTFIDLRDLANDKSEDDTIKMKLNAAKLDFEKACRRIIGWSYNDQVKKHEQKLLSCAEIICTTLSSCVGLRMEEVFGRSSKNNITCCIVDEATQSNEQETLIPLILGVKKIVLVGDPKQLPAVTQTKEAKDFGYGESLFSRILSNFPESGDNPVRLLTTQYRMHPEISQFPNTAFYNGQLTDSTGVKKRKSAFNVLKPYLVFNFDMEAIMNSQEYSNKAEIICVLKLLNVLRQKFEETFNFSVGIITPYNHQKSKIYEELRSKSFGASVTVNTVDSFQGQEKDVVIMSCVRESTNMFVTDEQRLNVALTRARHALYIIGSSSLFKSSGIFGKIRDDACRRQLFIKVNSRTSEFQLRNHISK